ncbi:MAG: PEP-CTERM sorting domain-containing protein [Kiritimatiellae bacterium]|nr:PEP-CTERM sorting domain-containing protein [Kiritimatiellia bacterium]
MGIEKTTAWLRESVAASLLLATTVPAQLVIVDNDFSGSPVGNYNGSTGQPLGSDPKLGNATGLRTALQVQGSGGVANSASFVHSQDVAMRARNTFNIANTTYSAVSFSVHFRFDPISTQLGGFLGVGWALSPATDGVSPYTVGDADRLLIGLRRTENVNNIARASSGGRLGQYGGAGTDIPATYFQGGIASTSLVVGTWYQFSFDLTFNYNSGNPANSSWTLANLRLRDWGSDGQTGGNTLILQTSPYTWNPGFGNNLDSSHGAYAYIAGNGDRGIQRIDSVAVQAIPEPATVGLLLLGLMAARFHRRRV